MDILATRENVPKYCEGMIDQIVHYKNTHGVTNRSLAISADVNIPHLSTVLSNQARCNGYKPIRNTQRVDLIIKIRKALMIKTEIMTHSGDELIDINDPVQLQLLRDKVLNYIDRFSGTYRSLEEKAGISRGIISSFRREPTRYLTTVYILHCYSYWIDAVYFKL